MKRIVWIIWIIIIPYMANAQLFSWQYPSPRVTASGGAMTATIDDQWAAYYNPAGLSQLEKKSVGLSYFNLYNLSFLKAIFLSVAIPVNETIGSFSLSYSHFGVNYQNEDINSETSVMISYGRYIFKDFNSSLAFGMNARLYRWDLGSSLQFGDLGSANALAFDVGFQASLYRRTWFGAYLTNVNSPSFGKNTKYELPKKIVVGVAYKPYSGVTTSFDINKDFESLETQYWGGVEFVINQYFVLRTGTKINPNQFTFGFGIHYKNLKVDYALLTHPELNETHQFGVVFVW